MATAGQRRSRPRAAAREAGATLPLACRGRLGHFRERTVNWDEPGWFGPRFQGSAAFVLPGCDPAIPISLPPAPKPVGQVGANTRCYSRLTAALPQTGRALYVDRNLFDPHGRALTKSEIVAGETQAIPLVEHGTIAFPTFNPPPNGGRAPPGSAPESPSQ
jgi:hypothetical protein